MSELSKVMRGRVLETLALIASEDVQRKYQRKVPYVDVPAELFNQWEDCYAPDDDIFRKGFAAEELNILSRFDDVLNQVSEDTPQKLPELEDFMKTEAWHKLATAAREALLGLVS